VLFPQLMRALPDLLFAGIFHDVPQGLRLMKGYPMKGCVRSELAFDGWWRSIKAQPRPRGLEGLEAGPCRPRFHSRPWTRIQGAPSCS
jgi:hypothetical protein